MTTLIVVLRVIHIACSAYWTGTTILMTAFVMPSVRAAGPGGRKFLQQLMGPGRLPLSILLTSMLGTASGLTLLGLVHGIRIGLLQSGFGLSMSLGSLLGVVALVHGAAVQRRLGSKIERASKEIQSAGRPPTADQLALLRGLEVKLVSGQKWSAVLLATSLTAMAAARYL